VTSPCLAIYFVISQSYKTKLSS